MRTNNIYVIHFSPTGGTKNYLCTAAKMFNSDYKEINLADFQTRQQNFKFDENDLVLIGAPVYYGRVPQIEGGIFNNLTANSTPAILFAVYGNRDYEDALLELKQISIEHGFNPIAAAALIAPHTFCQKATRDRPTTDDINALYDFIQRVKLKLSDDTALKEDLFVKGNFPFRTYGKAPFYPTGDDKCTKCGICFQICPVRAITKETPQETNKNKCIACMACVNICPVQSRALHSFIPRTLLKLFERKLGKQTKHPEFFI